MNSEIEILIVNQSYDLSVLEDSLDFKVMQEADDEDNSDG